MDRRLYCWIDGLYGWMITLLNVGISISIMKQLFIITQRHTDKKTEEEKMEEQVIDQSYVTFLQKFNDEKLFYRCRILTEGEFVSQLSSNERISFDGLCGLQQIVIRVLCYVIVCSLLIYGFIA
jgi:hypothetical protein